MESFFSASNPTDRTYIALRDDGWPPFVEARAYVDGAWPRCAKYLDRDLPARAAHQFPAHFWELYLAESFLNAGFALKPRTTRSKPREGPDLQLEFRDVWIEAVLATPGTGPDAVVEGVPGQPTGVPHDGMKLRLLSAVTAKIGKRLEYLEKGLVSPTDPFVIAVNAAEIPSASLESTIPRIVSSLLPFGHEQIHIDHATLKETGRSFVYQGSVPKLSGAEVQTDGFLSPEMEGVSAVLYSWGDVINRPSGIRRLLAVYNDKAANPLDIGLFRPVAVEYWCEGGVLNRHSAEAPNSAAAGAGGGLLP
ncbi:MAG: hypothetical protein HY699_25625 [Deltaproteobacteria bacterium]|nr:hypothetical protein [Deltaproteobacteria bacterium]